jgi:hypothetical protein
MLRRILGVVLMGVLGFVGCSPDDSAGGGGSTGGKDSGAGGAGGGAAASSGGASTGGNAGASTGGNAGATSSYDCANPDPAWIFCDDFEKMDGGWDAWWNAAGWTDHIGKDDPGRMTSSSAAHAGKWALHMPAAASAGHQGADLIFRPCDGANKAGCNLKGYPQLYFRSYLRLAVDHKKVHHFLALGGSQLNDYWSAYGNAGCRPNGKRHMGTTVDFTDGDHATFFYTYHPGMTCDTGANCDKYSNASQVCSECAGKDMPCSNGPECCWGHNFKPSPEVKLPLDQWVCFEMMMKPNDLGQKNGVMAYWIDGVLAHEEKSMHWRDDANLQMNMVRLQHYLTTGDAGGHSNQIWFDDVVVSTERIGCMPGG